jgi:membrane protein implicated in regulation of membrane protease activity
MTIIWLAVIGSLVIIELLTYGLYFAALAVAAVVPLLLSLLGLDLWVQGLGFLLAAIVALVFVKPITKKLQGEKPERLTNSDSLIGKEGLVMEAVDQNSGQVKVWGETWSAKTTKGSIPEGTKVVIEQIDGATLIVS